MALSFGECQTGYTWPVPIYEYRCDNGHLTERFQRMADPPLSSCDDCGAPVQKVLHPVAIHFKGKGFYNTDYGRGKGGGKGDGADGKQGGDAAGAGGGDSGGASGGESGGSPSADKSSSSSPAASSGSSGSSGSSSASGSSGSSGSSDSKG